ncbi:MAG: hypothetical protein ACTSSI_08435 [Candidatus Helarchaeota archaeon]
MGYGNWDLDPTVWTYSGASPDVWDNYDNPRAGTDQWWAWDSDGSTEITVIMEHDLDDISSDQLRLVEVVFASIIIDGVSSTLDIELRCYYDDSTFSVIDSVTCYTTTYTNLELSGNIPEGKVIDKMVLYFDLKLNGDPSAFYSILFELDRYEGIKPQIQSLDIPEYLKVGEQGSFVITWDQSFVDNSKLFLSFYETSRNLTLDMAEDWTSDYTFQWVGSFNVTGAYVTCVYTIYGWDNISASDSRILFVGDYPKSSYLSLFSNLDGFPLATKDFKVYLGEDEEVSLVNFRTFYGNWSKIYSSDVQAQLYDDYLQFSAVENGLKTNFQNDSNYNTNIYNTLIFNARVSNATELVVVYNPQLYEKDYYVEFTEDMSLLWYEVEIPFFVFNQYQNITSDYLYELGFLLKNSSIQISNIRIAKHYNQTYLQKNELKLNATGATVLEVLDTFTFNNNSFNAVLSEKLFSHYYYTNETYNTQISAADEDGGHDDWASTYSDGEHTYTYFAKGSWYGVGCNKIFYFRFYLNITNGSIITSANMSAYNYMSGVYTMSGDLQLIDEYNTSPISTTTNELNLDGETPRPAVSNTTTWTSFTFSGGTTGWRKFNVTNAVQYFMLEMNYSEDNWIGFRTSTPTTSGYFYFRSYDQGVPSEVAYLNITYQEPHPIYFHKRNKTMNISIDNIPSNIFNNSINIKINMNETGNYTVGIYNHTSTKFIDYNITNGWLNITDVGNHWLDENNSIYVYIYGNASEPFNITILNFTYNAFYNKTLYLGEHNFSISGFEHAYFSILNNETVNASFNAINNTYVFTHGIIENSTLWQHFSITINESIAMLQLEFQSLENNSLYLRELFGISNLTYRLISDENRQNPNSVSFDSESETLAILDYFNNVLYREEVNYSEFIDISLPITTITFQNNELEPRLVVIERGLGVEVQLIIPAESSISLRIYATAYKIEVRNLNMELLQLFDFSPHSASVNIISFGERQSIEIPASIPTWLWLLWLIAIFIIIAIIVNIAAWMITSKSVKNAIKKLRRKKRYERKGVVL